MAQKRQTGPFLPGDRAIWEDSLAGRGRFQNQSLGPVHGTLPKLLSGSWQPQTHRCRGEVAEARHWPLSQTQEASLCQQQPVI